MAYSVYLLVSLSTLRLESGIQQGWMYIANAVP